MDRQAEQIIQNWNKRFLEQILRGKLLVKFNLLVFVKNRSKSLRHNSQTTLLQPPHPV